MEQKRDTRKKTKSQHLTEKTYRKDRDENLNSLQVQGLVSIPEPPDYFPLNDDAKMIWKFQCEQLVQIGILHTMDLPALAVYCIEMERYFRNARVIEKKGEIFKTKTGHEQPRAELTIMRKAWESAHRIALDCGFTPLSRDKISSPQKEDKDALAKILDE